MLKELFSQTNQRAKQIFFLGLIVIFTATSFGCAPLKKKFTRKKKKGDEPKFIPVLSPIDYPPPRVSAAERYAYHYSMWQVWHRELIQKIDMRDSDKSQIYLLTQIITQVNEMKKWVKAEKQEGIGNVVDDLNKVMKMYDAPSQMRESSVVKSRLLRIAKEIKAGFKPEKVQEDLINAQ